MERENYKLERQKIYALPFLFIMYLTNSLWLVFLSALSLLITSISLAMATLTFFHKSTHDNLLKVSKNVINYTVKCLKVAIGSLSNAAECLYHFVIKCIVLPLLVVNDALYPLPRLANTKTKLPQDLDPEQSDTSSTFGDPSSSTYDNLVPADSDSDFDSNTCTKDSERAQPITMRSSAAFFKNDFTDGKESEHIELNMHRTIEPFKLTK